MDRSLWIGLSDAGETASAGVKAATLARLAAAGLPVVPGWVLSCERGAQARDDPALLDRAARELLAFDDCPRWLLRSSSPWEDRPGLSAAGWFTSEPAAASPDQLARALRRVLASAADPRVRERLGGTPPLAVLAQEHLRLDRWATAEWRDGEVFYEGWTLDGERWSSQGDPDFDPLVECAVQRTGIRPALLELGSRDGVPVLLQLRPAPARAPSAPRPEPASARFPGLGAAVHPGDEEREWVWDREHCPTPLSVLLATTFGRWIAADSGHTSSRLVEGRWHDPAGPATTTDAAGARAGWERWRHQLAERVEPALHALETRYARPGPDARDWERFLTAWFSVQQAYFALPGRRARSWARQRLGNRPPGLRHTPSTERIRRWSRLRERLLALDEAPAASPQAIAHWVAEHDDHPVAREVRDTARHDRVVAPLPYDGFTPGLDEDPWPLYRALASGLPDPRPREPAGEEEELAGAILSLAETDNELLLRAYAVWREAIRDLAERGGRTAADLHMLDVEVLEAWLAGAAFGEDAVRRGRALHAAWTVAPGSGAQAGELIEGVAAAGGTAQGVPERGHSLLELENDGGIAVVDTLGPADAIAVPRFAAIVCVAGDVLGHASVLCREFGVPCVVQVGEVGPRLARAEELLVDGDRGLVRILA